MIHDKHLPDQKNLPEAVKKLIEAKSYANIATLMPDIRGLGSLRALDPAAA